MDNLIRETFVEVMLRTPEHLHAKVRALWHEVADAPEVEVKGVIYSWDAQTGQDEGDVGAARAALIPDKVRADE